LQATVADAGQLLLVAFEIQHMQVADALAVGDKRQATVGAPGWIVIRRRVVGQV
jgi:hypothetical protein